MAPLCIHNFIDSSQIVKKKCKQYGCKIIMSTRSKTNLNGRLCFVVVFTIAIMILNDIYINYRYLYYPNSFWFSVFLRGSLRQLPRCTVLIPLIILAIKKIEITDCASGVVEDILEWSKTIIF